ncbi:MAG TPA: MTH938/NDUFAF3 family protein [Hyphomicrobiaceae bacterium]|nr:MTH938/NDUFAF3 family protein [Hyphomicrobiaceae bacterium]
MIKASSAHYPGIAPIDAYGNGGFRFAGMSHRGSILCLPSGIYAWEPAEPLDIASLAAALAEKDAVRVVILGTGPRQVFPAPAVRRAFAEAGVALEPMDTGAACRTYNVLLGEGRSVAAALMAVD